MARPCAYDWSQLDRSMLFGLVFELYDKVVGQPLPVQKFHDLVIRKIKRYMPIMSCKKTTSQVIKGWVYVGGAYYSDRDKQKLTSIELCLCYNPTDKIIKFTDRRFKRFCNGIADTILHEIIHMRQLRKRQFRHLPDFKSRVRKSKVRKEQEYLGNPDEIDAYSFNIACELDDKFAGQTDKIVKHIIYNRSCVPKSSSSFKMYLKAFEYQTHHTIIQRIKKRTIHYLPKARFGRPFRSCDWISR